MYELLSLLDTVLGTHVKHTHGEFYWNCPFCHHHKPKLAINLSKGAWHCWVCNVSGQKIRTLFKKMNCSREQYAELNKILDDGIKIDVNNTQSVQVSLPMEYHPLYRPTDSIDYKNALLYVTNRGITASDILRYQIGYCSTGPYNNKIIIPSYDAAGKLNYFVARSYYEDAEYPYKNPPVSKNIIAFESHINWKYPIVLCEGVYDAIAIKRNAIPLLGKLISDVLLEKIITENVRDIYLALDNDARKQTGNLALEFIKEGRNVYVVELEGKDPSELGFTKINQSIRHAKQLSFAELIKLRVTA